MWRCAHSRGAESACVHVVARHGKSEVPWGVLPTGPVLRFSPGIQFWGAPPPFLAEGRITSLCTVSGPDAMLARPRWQSLKDMTEIETFLGSYLLRGFCLDVFCPHSLSKGLKLLCRVSTTLVAGNSVLGNSPFLPLSLISY